MQKPKFTKQELSMVKTQSNQGYYDAHPQHRPELLWGALFASEGNQTRTHPRGSQNKNVKAKCDEDKYAETPAKAKFSQVECAKAKFAKATKASIVS